MPNDVRPICVAYIYNWMVNFGKFIYLYSQQVQLIEKKVKTNKSAKKLQQFTTMIISSTAVAITCSVAFLSN